MNILGTVLIRIAPIMFIVTDKIIKYKIIFSIKFISSYVQFLRLLVLTFITCIIKTTKIIHSITNNLLNNGQFTKSYNSLIIVKLSIKFISYANRIIDNR